jgi:hypothetical protein
MEQGARALKFESRAWAGGYLDLEIRAVILSHQGLQGYGYKVHNHHPYYLLMGNWAAKGAQTPHLHMQHTCFGALTWRHQCRELLHDGVEQGCSARCPQLRREE